jgi:hypothetical protein
MTERRFRITLAFQTRSSQAVQIAAPPRHSGVLNVSLL